MFLKLTTDGNPILVNMDQVGVVFRDTLTGGSELYFRNSMRPVDQSPEEIFKVMEGEQIGDHL